MDDFSRQMNNSRTIRINPNKIKVRDEQIKTMITATGGTARVFTDKKKAQKADKTGRKAKYKKELD